MFYTIKYAISYRNCDYSVSFDKSGNKYVVSVWNKAKHRTENRFESNRYEEAEKVFQKWCDAWDMQEVRETEQTWDATDFD